MARYQPDLKYVSEQKAEETCFKLFHNGLPGGPHCVKPRGHGDEEHGDYRFSWKKQPSVSAKQAEEFIISLQSMNFTPDTRVQLNDDGSVTMNFTTFKSVMRWHASAMRHDHA